MIINPLINQSIDEGRVHWGGLGVMVTPIFLKNWKFQVKTFKDLRILERPAIPNIFFLLFFFFFTLGQPKDFEFLLRAKIMKARLLLVIFA